MNFVARGTPPASSDRLGPRELVACSVLVVAAFLLATVPGRATGPTTVTPAASVVTGVASPLRTAPAERGPVTVSDHAIDVPVRADRPDPAWLRRGAPSAVQTPPPPPAPPTPVTAAELPAARPGGPALLDRSTPTRVRIPAIGVDAALMGLGLRPDGSMEVPPGAFPAGWYRGAPTPGELGPAILAGHVDHGGQAGVFFRLRELHAGDRVDVARADGSTAVFLVTRVEQHPKDAFPTAAVYGDIDHAGLRLITCGGPFDRGVGSYQDNVVVFARLDRVLDATITGAA